MATEHPDIQQELGYLLGAIARELGCEPSEVPFELEVVAKRALLSAYNKGFRRHRRLAESSPPAAREEASAAPAPQGGARDHNAGVYLYVDRTPTSTPEPRERGAEFPWADRMKSLLERALENQPKPIRLEGIDDDTDTE